MLGAEIGVQEIAGVATLALTLIAGLTAYLKTANERGPNIVGMYSSLTQSLRDEVERQRVIEKELREELAEVRAESDELRTENANLRRQVAEMSVTLSDVQARLARLEGEQR